MFRLKEREKERLKFKSCPECGNKTIAVQMEIPAYVTFSVRTGKCLKAPFYDEFTGGFFNCKCGWSEGANTINDLYIPFRR